jgi:RNA recognition motif-containing protein
MRHVKLSFLLFSAITRQCSALTAGAGAVASSNRIFVGGLSNQCTDQLLEESFAPFGTVVDISIIGLDTDGDGETKKRKPFAFITFDSTQSAVDAISINNSCDQIQNRCDQDLFQQVKRAEPIDRTKRKRSNASRTKEENHRDHILRICEQTNLLLQVQSTHADRLADYIQVIKSEHQHHDLEFKMEGLTNAVTKNMSLLIGSKVFILFI